jgi:UDP:flavonoid glycosyltransferase YjiC (YdhE family)
VLFVAHDAGGTIPPVLAVAESLTARGHAVTVLSQPSAAARAEVVGAWFEPFRGIGDYAVDLPIEDQLDVALPLLVGDAPARQALELAEAMDADVVVIDPNLGGVLAAFEAADRPTAVLLHSLYSTFVDVWFGEIWTLLAGPINDTRGTFGLEPSESWAGLFAGHDLVLSPVPGSFNPAPTPAPSVRDVGFLVPQSVPVDFRRSGDDPTLLVSLSTTFQHQLGPLAAILRAIGGLPVQAIVTTSTVVAHHALDPPPNVRLETHVPHAAVLGSCDLVVTHGGLGTVAAALTHGVPLVCQPVSRDQPLNAQQVAGLGAGEIVDADADAATIGATIQRVLGDRSYADRARAIAQESRDAGETAAATDAILAMVRR